ncbi:MAG: hypothetical protein AAGG51_14390 [Cyanobacteria bacterium P01_G01_bin.54]
MVQASKIPPPSEGHPSRASNARVTNASVTEPIALWDLMAVLSDVSSDVNEAVMRPEVPPAARRPSPALLRQPTPLTPQPLPLPPLAHPQPEPHRVRAPSPPPPQLPLAPLPAAAPLALKPPAIETAVPITAPALPPSQTLDPAPDPALDPTTTQSILTEPTLAGKGLPEKGLAELTQDLWDLRMVMLSDSDLYSQQIMRLKRRLWTVVGVATSATVLAGLLLGWLVISLRDAQMRLVHYDGAIANNSLRLDELDRTTVAQLTSQVETLNQQVPKTLAEDLDAANKDIEELKAQIEALETSVNAQDQALSVLVGAMQGLIGR